MNAAKPVRSASKRTTQNRAAKERPVKNELPQVSLKECQASEGKPAGVWPVVDLLPKKNVVEMAAFRQSLKGSTRGEHVSWWDNFTI